MRLEQLWRFHSFVFKASQVISVLLIQAVLLIAGLAGPAFMDGRRPFAGNWRENAVDGWRLSLAVFIEVLVAVVVVWVLRNLRRVRDVSQAALISAHVCAGAFIGCVELFKLFPMWWLPITALQVLALLGLFLCIGVIVRDIQPWRGFTRREEAELRRVIRRSRATMDERPVEADLVRQFAGDTP